MSTGILNLTNDLRDYLWEKGMKEHPVLAEIRLETAKLPESDMQISTEQGALKSNLVRLLSATLITSDISDGKIEKATLSELSSTFFSKALKP